MDIVIIANFCAALDSPTNSRFTYIADMLANDHKVEIVGSAFSHETKKKRLCDFSRFQYSITLIEEPGYLKNISIKRFLSHRVWGKNVLNYIKKRNKPDVIYCAIPSLTAASLVGEYCNQNNIRFIVDIQDLWPEAFQMVFRAPVLSSIAFKPFLKEANASYRAADSVVAVSKTYVERALAVNEKVKTGIPVFLGTDISVFDRYVVENNVDRNDTEFWVGYCGSLSDSYDIPCVIDAIKLINNPKIKLIVMGNGYLKEKFEFYAKQNDINSRFTGYMPYPKMCGMLSSCDIVINPIKGKSAATIINKHADYAASGLPVINTQDSREYRELIDRYHMGINCENGNAKDVAESIRYLLEHPSERKSMGLNARKCAEECFDRKNSYIEIINCIVHQETKGMMI